MKSFNCSVAAATGRTLMEWIIRFSPQRFLHYYYLLLYVGIGVNRSKTMRKKCVEKIDDFVFVTHFDLCSAENCKLNWKKICNIEVSLQHRIRICISTCVHTIPCAYCNFIDCPMKVNEEGERTNWPEKKKRKIKSHQ